MVRLGGRGGGEGHTRGPLEQAASNGTIEKIKPLGSEATTPAIKGDSIDNLHFTVTVNCADSLADTLVSGGDLRVFFSDLLSLGDGPLDRLKLRRFVRVAGDFPTSPTTSRTAEKECKDTDGQG